VPLFHEASDGFRRAYFEKDVGGARDCRHQEGGHREISGGGMRAGRANDLKRRTGTIHQNHERLQL